MRVSHRIITGFISVSFAVTALGACTVSKAETVVEPDIEFSFHLVRSESDNEAAMRLAEKGHTPPGAIYRPYSFDDGGLILEEKTSLNADCIKSASADTHPVAGYALVSFTFNNTCAKIFGEVTGRSIGKRFAVVLNGEIISAPTINSAITGGAGYIESNFSMSSATELATQLNAAAKKKVK